MTRTIFALLLISLSVAACDSGAPETNPNANSPAKVNAPAPTTPAPSASPEVSPSIKPQLKAGDKVKVATNGSVAEATVISVDEKSGQVTVKLQGESKEKTVAIGDIVKQ
jgi:hypothetical protein